MIFLFSILYGCADSSKDSTNTTNDTASFQAPDAPTLQWEEAFKINERPYALSADSQQQLIYCSGQSGENIYTWNNTGAPDRLTGSFDDVHGLRFVADGLYYTTSDHGVTGNLMHYQEGTSTVLVTQADDGTLFRWPMDLQQGPDDEWILADYNEAALFVFNTTGNTLRLSAGSSYPEVLAWHNDNLYIGGEDGIWRLEWPNGSPQQVDERAAYGLTAVHDEVWAVNSTDGIFAIGGTAAPIDEIQRPGKMLHFENMLYVADHAGQYVWMTATQEK